MNKLELTIGDKKYTAHFGFGFIEKCLESESVPDGDITKLTNMKRMYYSIAYGYDVRGESFMSKAEFYELLDELNADELEFLSVTYSIAFFRSWKKKLKLDPKAEKEFEKALNEEEKKLKPRKVATAAK